MFLNSIMINIWVNMYKVLNFIIFGVKIWLWVMVWNVNDDCVIVMLVKIIVNIFGIWCDKKYW